MTDMHLALANERLHSFRTEARRDGLARLARGCTPNAALTVVRTAWGRTLHWLRQGQLGATPGTCCV